MIIFILVSLALGFWEQTLFSIHETVRVVVVSVGLVISMACMIGVFRKASAIKLLQDIFLSSVLLAWYAYWRQQFNEDSPMFFFFPLYFVFIATLIEFILNGQSGQVDAVTLRHLQTVMSFWWMQSWFVMLLIFCSIFLIHQYLLFPVLVTLFMIHRLLGTFR